MPERHSMRKACPLLFLLMVACLGLFPTARGQDVTAAVTGSVVDPTGAGIVGANITAKDRERETTYAVQTNSAGVFQLPRSETAACGRADYGEPLPVRKPNSSIGGFADLRDCIHRQHALRRTPGNLAEALRRRLTGTDRIHLLE